MCKYFKYMIIHVYMISICIRAHMMLNIYLVHTNDVGVSIRISDGRYDRPRSSRLRQFLSSLKGNQQMGTRWDPPVNNVNGRCISETWSSNKIVYTYWSILGASSINKYTLSIYGIRVYIYIYGTNLMQDLSREQTEGPTFQKQKELRLHCRGGDR